MQCWNIFLLPHVHLEISFFPLNYPQESKENCEIWTRRKNVLFKENGKISSKTKNVAVSTQIKIVE